MQLFKSVSGSVSKTWNSINPATLSGACDVIVVEQEDGTLASSPFHVRFGKFSLLRPYEKKVEFKVNDVAQEYSMKLGEGGEAFFVFETSNAVPEGLQTSPLVSPAASPQAAPVVPAPVSGLPEPEPLDLTTGSESASKLELSRSLQSSATDGLATLLRDGTHSREQSLPINIGHSAADDSLTPTNAVLSKSFDGAELHPRIRVSDAESMEAQSHTVRSASPPPVTTSDAVTRAMNLSKRLWVSNIPSQINETGDLKLDMTGYKSNEEEALRAEMIARKILSEEFEGNYDIGSLVGLDTQGNLWIYSSEEKKEAAARQGGLVINGEAMRSTDAISDPGYHSDDARSDSGAEYAGTHIRRDSDSAIGLSSPPKTPEGTAGDPNRNYAKTLRLTSEQLKAMNLKLGANPCSFSVNRAVCQASIYFWRHDVPVVISDIDGTITKSDVLGHVLNTFGRDWTHLGVAKLYTDIVQNGYNILYLTSRSVGQADTTRTYLTGVVQDGYKLPKGPVIMSPDRTLAALRREVYLKKPEVFKMACLRDIRDLFHKPAGQTPFYAGFGNRLTDALSYRSVNIPSTRIFTINADGEVSLDLLSLNKYKTGYISMRETVDHFFPPVGLLVANGGEEFTDFNYWRDKPLEIEDFSDSGSEDDEGSLRSEDEGTEEADDNMDDLEASYYSRESIDEGDELGNSIVESIESDRMEPSILQQRIIEENEDSEDEEEDYEEGEDDEEGYDDDDEQIDTPIDEHLVSEAAQKVSGIRLVSENSAPVSEQSANKGKTKV